MWVGLGGWGRISPYLPAITDCRRYAAKDGIIRGETYLVCALNRGITYQRIEILLNLMTSCLDECNFYAKEDYFWYNES